MVYRNIIKRVLDFIISLISLIVLSPVLLLLAAMIKLDSKGPVLFKQKRFGINNTFFNIYKFRTMRIDSPKDTPTHLLNEPDKWITALGRFLRKSSLDELPQLINILKGEMSIVGPRPALWNQEDLIELRSKNKSNMIRPGLTGWAQVNGRDELPIEEKARLDGEYINNLSVFTDLVCILKTFENVLKFRNIVEGRPSK